MKTVNQILKLLNKTPETYETEFFQAYLRWCMAFATNYNNDLQKVVANSSISKYYNREHAKCEAKFLELISFYVNKINITPKEAQSMYNNCLFDMNNRFSKPLIEQAKKTNIYNDITAN